MSVKICSTLYIQKYCASRLILQAVETCGRDWRSVAQFMRKHAEVLGKAEDYHENVNKNDKKTPE